MIDAIFISEWPWWASGIAFGLFVTVYSFLFNSSFGFSSTLEFSLKSADAQSGETQSMQEAILQMAEEAGVTPEELGVDLAELENQSPASTGPTLSPRFMVLGVFLGAFVAAQLGGAKVESSLGVVHEAMYGLEGYLLALLLFGGGVIGGFGARMAGGCPSGHGLSGLSTLSVASLLAITGYFIGGSSLLFVLEALR